MYSDFIQQWVIYEVFYFCCVQTLNYVHFERHDSFLSFCFVIKLQIT